MGATCCRPENDELEVNPIINDYSQGNERNYFSNDETSGIINAKSGYKFEDSKDNQTEKGQNQEDEKQTPQTSQPMLQFEPSENLYLKIKELISDENLKLIQLDSNFFKANVENENQECSSYNKTFVLKGKSINVSVTKISLVNNGYNHALWTSQIGNLNNIFALSKIKHVNVIRPIAYYDYKEEMSVYILYENFTSTLRDFLCKKVLDFMSRLKILKALIEVMLLCHSLGYICLDYSIDNILFSQSKLSLKVSNFKSAFHTEQNRQAFLQSTMSNIEGSAPEFILSQQFTNKSDIWNLGIIICQLFTDSVSVFNHEAKTVSARARDDNGNKVNDDEENIRSLYTSKKLPEIYRRITDPYIQAITVGMLRLDPDERPTIKEVADVFNQYIDNFKFSNALKIKY